jgi:transcriptional regulator with XRE-family HTH domain
MSESVNSLRAARERRGMTRSEAARRAGVPYQALVRLESSALPPMVGRLVKVCDVIGADLREVVGDGGAGGGVHS